MSDLEEKVAEIYRERSVMDLTKAKEIIEIVKGECVEAVEKEKLTLDNQNGMAGFGVDIAIKAIKEVK